jgi:hypothetical protein
LIGACNWRCGAAFSKILDLDRGAPPKFCDRDRPDYSFANSANTDQPILIAKRGGDPRKNLKKYFVEKFRRGDGATE